MSTAIVWFFAVVYPLTTLAVWVAGAFGIAATMTETRQQIHARARKEHTLPQLYEADMLRLRLFSMWVLTVFIGVIWPVAVPMYFGWRKGSFINAAVEKRSENIVELNKRVA